MARSIDIFFNCDREIADILLRMNELLGFSFRGDPGRDREFYALSTGIALLLSKGHDFENDGEIDFERYEYDVSFSLMVESEDEWLNENFFLTSVKYISRILSERLSSDLIVVDDLEKIMPI